MGSNVHDDEALQWASIEKLPTYDKLRTSLLRFDREGERETVCEMVNVTKLNADDKKIFMENNFRDAEEDNEKFLRKLRDRIDAVGMQLPTVEVRFEGLGIEADCHVGSRALPTLVNTAQNILEAGLELVGVKLVKKARHNILKDVSGVRARLPGAIPEGGIAPCG